MAYYKVPENLAGKTLDDLMKQYGGTTSVYGQFTGLPTNAPLTAGQTFQLQDVPGTSFTGSTEGQNIARLFQPGTSPEEQKAATFQEEERGRLGEFTGRLQKVPEELEAVRQAMGIPEAFQTFGAAGTAARGISGTIRDLPQAVQQALSGQGVTAGQLAGRTAAEIKGLQPAIESATRGLEASGAGLQNLLSEFGSRTQAAFTGLGLEAQMLGQNIGQEFDLFKQQISSDLDRELANLSRQTTLDVAQLNRATQLAQLEQTASNIDFVDLGDRIGIFDFAGNLLRTEKKGKLGTLGDDGW